MLTFLLGKTCDRKEMLLSIPDSIKLNQESTNSKRYFN